MWLNLYSLTLLPHRDLLRLVVICLRCGWLGESILQRLSSLSRRMRLTASALPRPNRRCNAATPCDVRRMVIMVRIAVAAGSPDLICTSEGVAVNSRGSWALAGTSPTIPRTPFQQPSFCGRCGTPDTKAENSIVWVSARRERFWASGTLSRSQSAVVASVIDLHPDPSYHSRQ
jgi:hypothetical protein